MKEQEVNYVEELESAVIDLLDGDSEWRSVQYNTGLSDIRCKEITELFKKVLNNYDKRHGIKK